MQTQKQILIEVERTIAEGPFAATWDSLSDYRIPRWYQDAKFGIFIHWGPYSVPAFGNEWYPRQMYLDGLAEQGYNGFAHHVATYGPQAKFGYKDFIPQFKAERFNAAEWAKLFKESGAKFVMPVAEHHDGFAMYSTDLSHWNAANMGPRRDVLGQLKQALAEQDIRLCASSHRAEHWWFFSGGRLFDSDVNDPQFADLYAPAMPKETQPDQAFLDNWLARTCELVLKYQPLVVWFDWWIEQPAFAPYLKRFAAFYYNWAAKNGVEVAINYKLQAFPPSTAVFDIERGQVAGVRPLFWQNDTSVSKNSWGYIQNHDYKQAADIIGDLIDVVSKNGALLLNIGPRPDGSIPEPEQAILREIGQWLPVNGEAIYGTRPWKLFGEGPTEIAEGGFTDTKRTAFTGEDIRFTSREDVIYALPLASPADSVLQIKSLAAGKPQAPIDFARIERVGTNEPLSWTRDGESLRITVGQPTSFPPGALRLTPATM